MRLKTTEEQRAEWREMVRLRSERPERDADFLYDLSAASTPLLSDLDAALARVKELEGERDEAEEQSNNWRRAFDAAVEGKSATMARAERAAKALRETHELYCNGLECPICEWERELAAPGSKPEG